MEPWFSTYFEIGPNQNSRLNVFVADFDNPKVNLDETIFQSPLSQSINAVKDIVEKFDGPYILLASGGIDSQAMIWAWEQSGAPYEIYHYNYNGWNYHDTEYLIKFLDSVGLKHKLVIKDLDAMSFISSSELIDYAKEFDCSSPQILTYIKYVESTPGTPIQGGNYISQSVCGLSYTLMALQRHAEKHRPNYIPFFFQSRPQTAYSFYKMDHLFNTQTLDKKERYTAKCLSYETAGFPIIRQYEKYTGFEKIKKFFDSDEISITDKLRWKDEPSKRPFDIKFRYNLYDHIGYYNDKTTIKHHSKINNLLHGG